MSLMQGASYDTRHQRSRVLPCMLVSYRPLALLTRRCKTLAAVCPPEIACVSYRQLRQCPFIVALSHGPKSRFATSLAGPKRPCELHSSLLAPPLLAPRRPLQQQTRSAPGSTT